MGCVWAGGQARLGARAPGSGNLASRSRLPAVQTSCLWQPARKKISACDGGGWAAARAAARQEEPADLSVRFSALAHRHCPAVGAEDLGSLWPLEEKTIVHPNSGSRKLLRAAGGGRRAGDRNTTGWGWRWRARSDYPARRSLRVRWLGGIWLGPPKPAGAGARRALQAAGEEDGSGGPREGQRAHRVSDRSAAARA